MELIIDEIMDAFFNTSIYIGIAYACVIICMALDFITGVRKAIKNGEATTSRGFRKTANKATKYFNPMLVLSIVDLMLCIYIKIPAFTFLWAAYLCFCEFRSVLEKSWKKKEIKDAANTMKVIVDNKDELAKALIELMAKDKEEAI